MESASVGGRGCNDTMLNVARLHGHCAHRSARRYNAPEINLPSEGRLAVDVRRLRNPLTIAGLATAYYFLTSLALVRMPFTSLPSWWRGIWPTPKVGVYVWFGLLNA